VDSIEGCFGCHKTNFLIKNAFSWKPKKLTQTLWELATWVWFRIPQSMPNVRARWVAKTAARFYHSKFETNPPWLLHEPSLLQEIVDTVVWIVSRPNGSRYDGLLLVIFILLHRFFQLLTRNTTFNIVLGLDSKSLSSTLEMFSMHDRRLFIICDHWGVHPGYGFDDS